MAKIEWTDKTWNPIVGCSVVSPACTNCYAMRQAARISRMSPDLPQYQGVTETVNGKPVWTGKIGIAPDQKFFEPMRRKKPTVFFVNQTQCAPRLKPPKPRRGRTTSAQRPGPTELFYRQAPKPTSVIGPRTRSQMLRLLLCRCAETINT